MTQQADSQFEAGVKSLDQGDDSLLAADEDFDNLVNHFDDMLKLESMKQNRKLTQQDKEDLRSTKLVKRKTS